MSALGILAKGLGEGIGAGGKVLAGAEKDKRTDLRTQAKEERGEQYWSDRTEVLRKNNLDALVAQSNETRSGGAFKGDQQLNVREMNAIRNRARKAGVSLEEQMKTEGLTAASEKNALQTREDAKITANYDFDDFLKSKGGEKLSKDEEPVVRQQWEKAYIDLVKEGKGFSLTADQFVTHFLEARKELVTGELSDPDRNKAMMKDEGWDLKDPTGWISKKAREIVVGTIQQGKSMKGLSPEKQTQLDQATQRYKADLAASLNELRSPQEVRTMISKELANAKTQIAKAIIQDVGEQRLTALSGNNGIKPSSALDSTQSIPSRPFVTIGGKGVVEALTKPNATSTIPQSALGGDELPGA